VQVPLSVDSAKFRRVRANVARGFGFSIAAFAPSIGDGGGRYREWERKIHKSK